MTPFEPGRAPAPAPGGPFADLVRAGLDWIDESGGSGEVRRLGHGIGPGSVLGGRFELLREVGRGTCVVVYHALHLGRHREMAIQVFRPHLLPSEEDCRRFGREARAIIKLGHDSIVPLHDAVVDGPTCYLVYPLRPGLDLAEWIRRHDGPVPWRVAGRILAGLSSAVEHAHARGVLHRDIRPDHIRIGPGRPGDLGVTPELGGFVPACLLEAVAGSDRSGPPFGLPAQPTPGPAADIAALGAILYELLAGVPPHAEAPHRSPGGEPRRLRAARPDIPRDLEAICLRCLGTEPGRRYESARALGDDLDRLLRGEPIRGAGPIRRLAAWARRRNRLPPRW